MLKKIRELFKKYKEEKGQGVVEYALVLGFVAVLAVYLIQSSGLESKVQTNVQNAGKTLDAMDSAFSSAGGSSLSASSSSSS